MFRAMVTTLLLLFAFAPAYGQMKYENIKFYVHSTKQPETVRLYRLSLKDGSHRYTTSKTEVDYLQKSLKRKAQIVPFDAYVYEKQVPGTVRLYRILFSGKDETHLLMMTAFEPEMLLHKNAGRKIHTMKAYVFPHTFKKTNAPRSVNTKDIVPMYSFYGGGHNQFYTTSEVEKKQLLKIYDIAMAAKHLEEKTRQQEMAAKIKVRRQVVAARYRAIRKREPTAVGFKGTPIHVGNVKWAVVDVKNKGKLLKSTNQFIDTETTKGKFIWVEVQVENESNSPLTMTAPILIDEKSRRFTNKTAIFHIPEDKSFFILKTLNPAVPFNGVLIYEVPEDALGLTLLVGDMNILSSNEGVIDLGL